MTWSVCEQWRLTITGPDKSLVTPSGARTAIVAPTIAAPPLADRLAALVLAAWFVYLLFGSTNGFGWIDSWHNEQRAVQLILLVATAGVLLTLSLTGPVSDIPAFPWPMWAALLAGLTSAMLAGFRFAAFGEVSLYTSLAGLVILSTLTFRRAQRGAAWFGRSILLLAAAHCVGMFVRYLAAIGTNHALTDEVLLLGFANPRFQSALYVLLMPFLAHKARAEFERPSVRFTAFALLALLWTFNIALGTRAVPFALGIGSALFIVLVGKRRGLNTLLVLLASLLLGALLYGLMFHLVPDWIVGSGGQTVRIGRALNPSGRDLLIRIGVAAMLDSPVFGIGPMQFAALAGVPNAHPHNWLVQIAAEYGLPTLLVVFVATVAWLIRLRKQLQVLAPSDGGLLDPALLMTLTALSCGLVDGNLVMPMSQSATAIGLGLLIACLPRGERNAWHRTRAYSSVLAVAIATSILAVYGVASFNDQQFSVLHFRQLYPPNSEFAPRFWEQGLLIKAD